MPPPIRFCAFEIQPATRQLLTGGLPAAVGARAFELLLALIERRERVVTKSELLDIVWPQAVVEESNLHVHVSALRKLLGPAAIATIPGRGYQFVTALEGTELAAGAPMNAPSPSAVLPAPAAGNLTPHRPPLFGRQADLSRLLAHVEEHRLVTILGAAGMGKTVLAMAAAQALRERWPDGAWWVELATVSDPAQLAHAVAQALRITLPAAVDGDAALDHLASVLSPLSLLLVLDNCEHLVDAAGTLAERIVTQAPGVRVLTTSQELLNVPGEALFKLDPLAVPSVDETPAEAARQGAMLLFAARARTADARFALTPDNPMDVAEICRRLDGLPLAIELAAARVRHLGVQGLRDKLGERFRVLTGGARTAMRRHQTLLAAVDWSHALLSPTEQVVLRRLGVFVGGFALELGQAVAQDEQLDAWAVLDALSALVDKSLVIADASEPPRYRLLETTRAYALEKLAPAGETDAWIERHARAVCEFFELSEDARYGEQGTLSHQQFTQLAVPELVNARAALARAASAAGHLDLAVGLAGSMAAALTDLALAVEALEILSRWHAGLDDTVQPARAARLYTWLADVGWRTGNTPAPLVLEAADRAERFYRERAMPRRLHKALFPKGMILIFTGQWRAAEDLLPQMRRLQTPPWPAWQRNDLFSLQGAVHEMQGRHEQAYAVYCLQRARLQGLAGERRVLIGSENNLCRSLYLMGRHEECIALARSVIAREAGKPASAMPYLTLHLLCSQVIAGHFDDARLTLALALPGWRRHGQTFRAAGAMARWRSCVPNGGCGPMEPVSAGRRWPRLATAPCGTTRASATRPHSGKPCSPRRPVQLLISNVGWPKAGSWMRLPLRPSPNGPPCPPGTVLFKSTQKGVP